MRVESLFTARRMCREAIDMISARPDHAWKATRSFRGCVYDKKVNGGCAIGGLRPSHRAEHWEMGSISIVFEAAVHMQMDMGLEAKDFLDALSIPEVCWQDRDFVIFCSRLQGCHDDSQDRQTCIFRMMTLLESVV